MNIACSGRSAASSWRCTMPGWDDARFARAGQFRRQLVPHAFQGVSPMINAAIVGLGWWGKTLVESAANSEAIRFVAGATRTVTPEVEAFAKQHGLRLLPKYEAVLADREVDAVVLATPHS